MTDLSKSISIGISIVISYVLTLGAFYFFKIQSPFSELIFLLTMFSIAFLILKSRKLLFDRMSVICSGIFSVMLAVSFVIGRKIHMWEKPYFDYFKFSDVIFFVLIALLLFIITINALNFICKLSLTVAPQKTSYKFFLLIFAITVVSRLPYFFIYYPGNLSPDSFSTLNQCLGITPYSNHHPIAFTFFVNICVRLGLLMGDLNFAIACFSFVHLLIMSGILSYAVYWMKKKGFPNYTVMLTAVFFIVNPVIAMYSITMWKDVIFSGFILLLILYTYDIIETDGANLQNPKGLLKLIILCSLVIFSRNNGLYVVIPLLFTLAIYFKRYYKLLVPVFLSFILVITILQGPVYKSFGIKQSNFAESISIPLQQIGYTLEQGADVNDKQQDFLNKLLPTETIAEEYRPNSPDYIKFHPDFNNEFLNKNKLNFLKVWASMLPSNFSRYVKGWLMQTLGYYHIGTTNWIVFDAIDETNTGINSLGVVRTDFIYALIRVDLKPFLNKLFKNIRTFPLVRNIFSIALMVWITFFSSMVMFLRKRSKYIISLIPLLFIWITMMIANPTFCEFRYMFSFHLAMPFVIIMMFIKNQPTNKSKSE